MQEDKEGIFDALDTWQDCVDMATFVLDELKVNTDRTREAALKRLLKCNRASRLSCGKRCTIP